MESASFAGMPLHVRTIRASHSPWRHCLRGQLGVRWVSSQSACRENSCCDGVVCRDQSSNTMGTEANSNDFGVFWN